MSTYVPISTQTLSSAANSITFSGIPQTYTDLKLVMANAKATNAPRNVLIRVGNGSVDTASNYSHTNLGARSLSTTPFSQRESNQTSGKLSWYTAMTTAQAQMSIVDIMNYSNTTTNKTMLCSTRVQEGDGTYSGVEDLVILWRSTSAINVISVLTDVADTFQSGTTFTLYGIGAGSPKAFGGDEVRTDGTYWYHIYRSSGIFAPMQNLSCDYVVVAGGGGGAAGGSGAGGFKTSIGGSPLSLTAGSNNTVTIGGGGTGATLSYGASTAGRTKGTNSVFSTITATGGGGAGAGPDASGGGTDANLSGGSGGGATYSSGVSKYGTGISGEGNNGGQDVFDNPPYSGAGGGGAGAVGQNNQSNSVAGNGGAGTFNAITNAALVGQLSGGNYYLAGGGGGGIYGLAGSGTGGTGGLGGGGNGCNGTSGTDVGQNGTANTGGGAGGSSADATGRAGGSGIVVVRYLV